MEGDDVMDWKFDTPRRPIFQQPYTLSAKRPFGVFSDGTEPTDRFYDQWALSSDGMEITESHHDQSAHSLVDWDIANREFNDSAQETNHANSTELTDDQWPLPPVDWDAVRRELRAAAQDATRAANRNHNVPTPPVRIVEDYAAVREVYHPDLPRLWYDRVIRGLQWTAFTIYTVGTITTVAAVRAGRRE